MDQQRPVSQKLPINLASMLNSPEENRDSAYYSSTDASSKHNSTASGMGILSPTGSGFRASPSDKTPSPTTTTNMLPQPLVSPVNSNMSITSMVSPTTPGSADPRRFDRPQSLDSAPGSATFGSNGARPDPLSRRESVDSRINQGFGDMRLGGNSPYASHNQSTTSIHNTLQQQRNPRSNFESLAVNRISNGYQPSAERTPDGPHKVTRVAPVISGPATSSVARAAEPTKGQAWAFPEEEIHRVSSAGQSLIDSRRSSIAESLASSQYTTESRLPPGQRRFDESNPHDFHRMSNASGEFPTHHHRLQQHKQLGDLQNEEMGSQTGSQPYSRTPELRISHKLAERKRRTEMKELFEQLRDLMPQERGSKASKWEILTKAISEHNRLTDNVDKLQRHCHAQSQEIEKLVRRVHELEKMYRGGVPPPQPPMPMADAYGQDYGRARQELPPLRSAIQPGAVPHQQQHQQQQVVPDSMTGVQYEPPRVNGFRQEPGRF